LQVSFFPGLTAGKIVPDIVLILIIIWSSQRRFEDIWLGILFSGIFLDLVVFSKIGVNAISFVLISFITSFLQRRFFITQKLSSFFVILAIVMGGTFFNFLITNFLTDFNVSFSWSWLGMKMFANLIVAIFVYIITTRFKGILGVKETGLIVN
jgi:rod shape-determining protein MreD